MKENNEPQVILRKKFDVLFFIGNLARENSEVF